MPSVFTLDGPSADKRKKKDGCRCVPNPRTKRAALFCPVGKDKSRSGWSFVKDEKGRCRKG